MKVTGKTNLSYNNDSTEQTGHPGQNGPSRSLRIGIVYDRVQEYQDFVNDTDPPDRFAEFEPESTIEVMEKAITLAGHLPVRIGSPQQLLESGPPVSEVDLVWNIGEGYGSRNREAWAPVVCEMKGIPCIGSDAYALTLTLDKALAKQVARNLGIPTADWQVIPYDETTRHTSVPDPILPFPLFLKPRYEGTSKGISEKSLVHTREAFRKQCRHLLETYRQDVLAELFLGGPELTCALVGQPLAALPVLERGLHASGIGSHAINRQAHLDAIANVTPRSENAFQNHSDIRVSGAITPEREAQIAEWSQKLVEAIGARDFVRIDYKLSGEGHLMFLEANPLPSFNIRSTFSIIAEIQGQRYPQFLSHILGSAIRRLHLSV